MTRGDWQWRPDNELACLLLDLSPIFTTAQWAERWIHRTKFRCLNMLQPNSYKDHISLLDHGWVCGELSIERQGELFLKGSDSKITMSAKYKSDNRPLLRPEISVMFSISLQTYTTAKARFDIGESPQFHNSTRSLKWPNMQNPEIPWCFIRGNLHISEIFDDTHIFWIKMEVRNWVYRPKSDFIFFFTAPLYAPCWA